MTRPKIGPVPFPARFEMIILFSTENYCIVGAPSRWFLYVMARSPTVSEDELEQLKFRVEKEWGYDISKFRRVPQQWPAKP